ncbi:MAG: deoxyribonuclease IV, partial [Acidimicrobiales bacterium]
MLIGAHVSSAGGPLRALDRAEEMGAEAVQLHVGSPRVWKTPAYGEAVFDSYLARSASSPVRATFCHASYLINLATDDDALFERSRLCLAENLYFAGGTGAAGLVLHLGSHKGAGAGAAVVQVAGALCCALDAAGEAVSRTGWTPAPLLIENTAGAGGTLGRSFEEIASVIAAAGGDERIGACLDTQHLFATGGAFETVGEADEVVAALDDAIGIGRLRCVHLNDSAVPRGAKRDRHANLGEGYIGA